MRRISPPADQVELVGDDDWGDALFLGDDQEAVQHAQVWCRVGAGKNKDSLVRVSQQHLFVLAFGIGCHANQGTPARFHAFDNPTSIR